MPLVTGQIRVRQRDFDQAVVSGIQEKSMVNWTGIKAVGDGKAAVLL